MSGSQDFFKSLAASIPRLERELARTVVAVEAERFHAENFRLGGFQGAAFEPWPPRQKADPGRALLVKSGAMKGHAMKGRASAGTVRFLFPLPYMEAHNEGKAPQPKRQYVGDSPVLRRRINQAAARFLNDKLNRL